MIRSLPNPLFSADEVARRTEEAGIDQMHADTIRSYSENLRKQDLPILLDHEWLSQLLGWDTKTIYAVAACQKDFYRTYQINKRSGSSRLISEPLPTLKDIQSTLLDYIFSKIAVHKSSYAYRKGNTIRKNARIHLRQPQILKLDIKDFFGSIKQGYVSKVLIDSGYTREIATLIARLCTLDGALAQGAPSSPAISNVVMYKIDEELMNHFSSNGMRYTRYSDDITISGAIVSSDDIRFVSDVLYQNRFYLNSAKTRIFRSGSAKVVTSVQVNSKIRAPKELRDTLRAELYFIEKFGLPSHATKKGEKPSLCLRRVEGQLNFSIWLDPKDNALADLKTRLRDVRRDFDSLSSQVGF